MEKGFSYFPDESLEVSCTKLAICNATAVEKVSLGFGTTQQTWVDKMLVSEARQYLGAGEFPSGSMGPKIAGILEILGAGGRAGLITNPPNLGRAVAGGTGTCVYADRVVWISLGAARQKWVRLLYRKPSGD